MSDEPTNTTKERDIYESAEIQHNVEINKSELEMIRDFIFWEDKSRDCIDVKRIYIDIAGDLAAGTHLSQIIFWFLPDSQGKSKLRIKKYGRMWLAKANTEWWDECRLSEKQIRRTTKVLVDKHLIETRVFKFSGNPTVHYHLNFINLIRAIKAFSQNNRSQQFDIIGYVPKVQKEITQRDESILTFGTDGNCPKGQKEIAQRDKSLTEIKAEITTEITTKDINTTTDQDTAPDPDNNISNLNDINLDNQSSLIENNEENKDVRPNPPHSGTPPHRGTGTRELLKKYTELFVAMYGVIPPVEFGRDGKILKNLLVIYSLDNLVQYMEAFFKMKHYQIESNGHTIPTFHRLIPAILIQFKNNPRMDTTKKEFFYYENPLKNPDAKKYTREEVPVGDMVWEADGSRYEMGT